MEEQRVPRLRCQRIGCDATFTEEDNPEGSCCYHGSGPIFHDGMKEWSCCKRRSHDFSLFLEIPGCKTGKHTTEKPVLAATGTRKQMPIPSHAAVPAANASSKESCPRCQQGFFCSDHELQDCNLEVADSQFQFLKQSLYICGDQVCVHLVCPRHCGSLLLPSFSALRLLLYDYAEVSGSQAKELDSEHVVSSANVVVQGSSAPVKKIVDINQPQTCKNKGCGNIFKEKDNHETACSYHPGPAVFHDRVKGWKCCDIHVNEFDEFMNIPPCTKGWHSADPVS